LSTHEHLLFVFGALTVNVCLFQMDINY